LPDLVWNRGEVWADLELGADCSRCGGTSQDFEDVWDNSLYTDIACELAFYSGVLAHVLVAGCINQSFCLGFVCPRVSAVFNQLVPFFGNIGEAFLAEFASRTISCRCIRHLQS
jgi:hypothetical protein